MCLLAFDYIPSADSPFKASLLCEEMLKGLLSPLFYPHLASFYPPLSPLLFPHLPLKSPQNPLKSFPYSFPPYPSIVSL